MISSSHSAPPPAELPKPPIDAARQAAIDALKAKRAAAAGLPPPKSEVEKAAEKPRTTIKLKNFVIPKRAPEGGGGASAGGGFGEPPAPAAQAAATGTSKPPAPAAAQAGAGTAAANRKRPALKRPPPRRGQEEPGAKRAHPDHDAEE